MKKKKKKEKKKYVALSGDCLMERQKQLHEYPCNNSKILSLSRSFISSPSLPVWKLVSCPFLNTWGLYLCQLRFRHRTYCLHTRFPYISTNCTRRREGNFQVITLYTSSHMSLLTCSMTSRLTADWRIMRKKFRSYKNKLFQKRFVFKKLLGSSVCFSV